MKTDKEKLIELKVACQNLINFIYKKYDTKTLTCEYLQKIDQLVNKEQK